MRQKRQVRLSHSVPYEPPARLPQIVRLVPSHRDNLRRILGNASENAPERARWPERGRKRTSVRDRRLKARLPPWRVCSVDWLRGLVKPRSVYETNVPDDFVSSGSLPRRASAGRARSGARQSRSRRPFCRCSSWGCGCYPPGGAPRSRPPRAWGRAPW